MGEIKVLTVNRPWATLILNGIKTLEVRTQRFSHRGRLGIHVAAQDAKPSDLSERERQCVEAALARCGNLSVPRRHLVGEVELVEIRPMTAADAFEGGSYAEYEPYVDRPPLVWVLREPRLYPTPIPMRGGLGLWTAADPLS